MEEKIYTIPVNEAFDKDSECPFCEIKKLLLDDALDFCLGPSYMDDTVRLVTDKTGFCKEHVQALYQKGNRLGLALMMKTHADKVIRDTEKLVNSSKPGRTSLFKKSEGDSPLIKNLKEIEHSCYMCDRINQTFERYIGTTLYLYNTESDFRIKYRNSKGFCNEHLICLLEKAPGAISKEWIDEFYKDTTNLYLENMKRVRDDLSWFIDKFDYRYVNEPWKNSKDALPRMIQKINSIKDIEK